MTTTEFIIDKDEAQVTLDALLKTATVSDPFTSTFLVERLENFLAIPSFSMLDPAGNKQLGVFKTVGIDMDSPDSTINDEFMIGLEISDPYDAQLHGEILFTQNQALELCEKMLDLIKDPCSTTKALEIAKKYRAKVLAERTAGIE